MRRIITFTFCVAALPSLLSAAPAPEINGVTLGESYEQIKSSGLELLRCSEYGTAPNCTFVTTIAGMGAKIMVTFHGGKVSQIDALDLDPDNFSAVEGALRKHFGKPSLVHNAVVRNGFGARFDDRVLVWKYAGWQLQAKKRDGAVDRSSINLFTDDAGARADAAAQAKLDDL
jgi:hypothetical protein